MPAALGAQGAPSEYHVKAALLYNFAKYVRWPEGAAEGGEGGRFVIAILGQDPFGVAIDSVLEGKTIDGLQVVVRRIKASEELTPSQILFISDSERGRLPEILGRLDAAATLTVGEMDHFAEAGGVIRFLMDDRRVHLEINVAAAARARLKLSSELLKLARIVGQRAGG